jgi:hypothetical protein
MHLALGHDLALTPIYHHGRISKMVGTKETIPRESNNGFEKARS